MAVRLSDDDLELIQKLTVLHHRLGDIPEATASAYLRWLLTGDVEESVQEITKRRQQIAQG